MRHYVALAIVLLFSVLSATCAHAAPPTKSEDLRIQNALKGVESWIPLEGRLGPSPKGGQRDRDSAIISLYDRAKTLAAHRFGSTGKLMGESVICWERESPKKGKFYVVVKIEKTLRIYDMDKSMRVKPVALQTLGGGSYLYRIYDNNSKPIGTRAGYDCLTLKDEDGRIRYAIVSDISKALVIASSYDLDTVKKSTRTRSNSMHAESIQVRYY